MRIGKALAPWPTRPTTVVVGLVWVPPNFLQLWMLDFLLFHYQHDAVRVFRDGVDLLDFRIFCCQPRRPRSWFKGMLASYC